MGLGSTANPQLRIGTKPKYPNTHIDMIIICKLYLQSQLKPFLCASVHP